MTFDQFHPGPSQRTLGIRFPRSRGWQVVELLYGLVGGIAIGVAVITVIAFAYQWFGGAFVIGVAAAGFIGYQFGKDHPHNTTPDA